MGSETERTRSQSWTLKFLINKKLSIKNCLKKVEPNKRQIKPTFPAIYCYSEWLPNSPTPCGNVRHWLLWWQGSHLEGFNLTFPPPTSRHFSSSHPRLLAKDVKLLTPKWPPQKNNCLHFWFLLGTSAVYIFLFGFCWRWTRSQRLWPDNSNSLKTCCTIFGICTTWQQQSQPSDTKSLGRRFSICKISTGLECRYTYIATRGGSDMDATS